MIRLPLPRLFPLTPRSLPGPSILLLAPPVFAARVYPPLDNTIPSGKNAGAAGRRIRRQLDLQCAESEPADSVRGIDSTLPDMSDLA
jgi:hypothetical protein